MILVLYVVFTKFENQVITNLYYYEKTYRIIVFMFCCR